MIQAPYRCRQASRGAAALWLYLLSILALVWTCEARMPKAPHNKVQLERVRRTRSLRPQALASDVAITNQQEFSYLAVINIGGQNFRLVLDTGSSDLWVVSGTCNANDCKNVPQYTASPSLVKNSTPFKLNYLLGSVRGAIGFETITLGQYQVSSQVFAMADQTMGMNLRDSGHSGIIGFSFPVEASIPLSVGQPLLDNLFSQVNDSRKFFALKLSRIESSSSFTIGQLDPEVPVNTSAFTYSPVYPRVNASDDKKAVYDYWKLPLHGLTLDNVSLPLSPSKIAGSTRPLAVLDTGTTLILGPRRDIDNFWNTVGGAKKEKDGWWHVRCDRGIVVSFIFGEDDARRAYPIHPQDLSWEEGGKDGDWCMGGLQANDGVNSGDWLLGDVFLRNVYVTHHYIDPPKIGLVSTTNVDEALASFRAERGNDTLPPVQSIRPLQALATQWDIGTAGIYATSLVAGFAGGALAMFLGLRVGRMTGGSRKCR